MATAIVVAGYDVITGCFGITITEFSEQITFKVGFPMVQITEHVWGTSHRDGTVGSTGEKIAGVDHVDGTESKTLVDIGFLAKRRCRKNLNIVTTRRYVL